MGRPRKLTDRRAAVLAAVERRGRPVMADLWQDFPDLQPSAIRRVLDGLERRGLISYAGDESLVYLNGVSWWPTAGEEEESARYTAMREALGSRSLGLRVSADPHAGMLRLFLPLVEVEAVLAGLPSAAVQRIQDARELLERHGVQTRLTVVSRIGIEPEPMLVVQIEPSDVAPVGRLTETRGHDPGEPPAPGDGRGGDIAA